MTGPSEARWVRPEPRRELSAQAMRKISELALGGRKIVAVEPLAHGYRNTNWKAFVDGSKDCMVVRIYEHDPSLCEKEADLLRMIDGAVPVPEVLHIESSGDEELPPFAVLRFVEGIPLHDLKRAGDPRAIAEASFSAGEVLAAIHAFKLEKPGWISPGPRVTTPLLPGENAGPRFADLCLENEFVRQRLPEPVRHTLHRLMWSMAPQFAVHDACSSLVHCDFGSRNIIVTQKDGRWRVAAVLDWEFAVSGCPLTDIGHFLRYEAESRPLREPHFTAGYQSRGGTLPENWRRLARLTDAIALVESLTHAALPGHISAELTELITAAGEERDPAI